VITRITDIFSDFWNLYQGGGPARGASTGWPGLDAYYTVRPGEWTLITGIPGHGKSSFLDNLIVNLARDKDWKFLVFSAENQPVVRHAAGLASIYIGKPFGPSERARMDREDWSYAGAFLDTQIAFLDPAFMDCTLDWILSAAREEIQYRGLNALVIDPWNELDHSRPAGMTETEHISAALSKIRRFAREHSVHIFVVAHPTKLQRDRTLEGNSNTYPVPTPWDVAGSAHWRNKADNCLTVWRDVTDELHETHIHIQKIRFREVGRVGVCKMYYDLPSGQFIDPLIGVRPAFSAEKYNTDLDQRIESHRQELRELQAVIREPGEEG
jgi:twinkle protein